MASDVDICNVALGYLGDSANITNLSPPDGSAQAAYCVRFYPMARDALQELHPWGFCTVRVQLALLDAIAPSTWKYAYALPNDAVNLLEVLDPNAADDYSVGLTQPWSVPGTVPPAAGNYTPQPYQVETINDADVILTDQENAVLRYTRIVKDTTKFSPLFNMGLSRLLASMLAGPLLKGEAGREASAEQTKLFSDWYAQATESDANQRRTQVAQRTSWMANR